MKKLSIRVAFSRFFSVYELTGFVPVDDTNDLSGFIEQATG